MTTHCIYFYLFFIFSKIEYVNQSYCYYFCCFVVLCFFLKERINTDIVKTFSIQTYKSYNLSPLMQLSTKHNPSPCENILNLSDLSIKFFYHAKFVTRSCKNGIRDKQCRVFWDALWWLLLAANVIQECCLLEPKQDHFVSGYVEIFPFLTYL